ncbi:MAG: AhpC/TSA family protein [Chloroflexi bacterium]|nr:MAG: AhpC/TSA family protein [Chloroflexota bacterium]
MSLNAELTKMREERAAKRPAAASQLLAAEMERWLGAGLEAQSLQVGDKIPPFALGNAVGQTVSADDLLKAGPLVISFYRGAWCPYCNLELRTLQQALPDIRAAGGQLVAISPNQPDSSLSSVEKHGLTFEVLSDVGNHVARQFGLVFSVGSDVRPMFQKVGFDIPGQNGDDTWEIPVPATYVVNPAGQVVYRFVDPNYTRRAEPADIVAALQAIR